MVRFWGTYTQDLAKFQMNLGQTLGGPRVLVSTPQRIVNLLAARSAGADEVLSELKQSVGLIVVDEAHRAAPDRISAS